MLSPTHTGTFITCGVWTLLGEAHSAPPSGDRLGSHTITLDFPCHTGADHHLRVVPLNDGLSDDVHDVRTVTPVLQI